MSRFVRLRNWKAARTTPGRRVGSVARRRLARRSPEPSGTRVQWRARRSLSLSLSGTLTSRATSGRRCGFQTRRRRHDDAAPLRARPPPLSCRFSATLPSIFSSFSFPFGLLRAHRTAASRGVASRRRAQSRAPPMPTPAPFKTTHETSIKFLNFIFYRKTVLIDDHCNGSFLFSSVKTIQESEPLVFSSALARWRHCRSTY